MTTFPEQTVLIVDDDRTNRMILAGVLKDECHVILAKDGASALRLAQENEDICLILLDIGMPEMDGYRVLRNLRSDTRTSHIPVVFITGSTEEKEEEYGLLLGAADYVFKPVRPAIVRARIRNLLKTAALDRKLACSTSRDAPTGLFTRAYFEEALATICALAANSKEPLGLALVEIDNFDPAASAPDRPNILKHIARCLENQAARPFEIAARHGEASFALLLLRAAEIDKTLEKIRQSVQALNAPDASTSLSASIGAITALGTGGRAPDVLLGRAQAMLAEAKSENGNRVALSHLDAPPT